MIALGVAAFVVAIGCAAACIARLHFVTSATTFHPAVLLVRIRRGEAERVREAIAKEPTATWERDLLDAVSDPNEEVRAGRINEQITELDYRLGRWQRVPRVCASVASSAGFLLGSLVLRFGLVAATSTSDDLQGDAINDVVVQAINVAVFGVAGATFAIAAQYRAKRLAKAFQRDADALVEALEPPAEG